MPDTEVGEVNFVLALGLAARGGFEGGEFIVLLVLPGDHPALVNLHLDVESEISFGQKELWTKAWE